MKVKEGEREKEKGERNIGKGETKDWKTKEGRKRLIEIDTQTYTGVDSQVET